MLLGILRLKAPTQTSLCDGDRQRCSIGPISVFQLDRVVRYAALLLTKHGLEPPPTHLYEFFDGTPPTEVGTLVVKGERERSQSEMSRPAHPRQRFHSPLPGGKDLAVSAFELPLGRVGRTSAFLQDLKRLPLSRRWRWCPASAARPPSSATPGSTPSTRSSGPAPPLLPDPPGPPRRRGSSVSSLCLKGVHGAGVPGVLRPQGNRARGRPSWLWRVSGAEFRQRTSFLGADTTRRPQQVDQLARVKVGSN